MTVEDLVPLPKEVTGLNARQVVRQCLQRHRRAAADVHRRIGYVFRPGGFVQLVFTPANDRGEPARACRVFVEYVAVSSAAAEIHTDVSAFREVVRVILRGRFGEWQGIVTPYRSPPAVGDEPSLRERGVLELDFPSSEAEAAGKLVEAIRALMD